MNKLVKIKVNFKTWENGRFVYRGKVVAVERQLDKHGFVKDKAERDLVDSWLLENVPNYYNTISYDMSRAH